MFQDLVAYVATVRRRTSPRNDRHLSFGITFRYLPDHFLILGDIVFLLSDFPPMRSPTFKSVISDLAKLPRCLTGRFTDQFRPWFVSNAKTVKFLDWRRTWSPRLFINHVLFVMASSSRPMFMFMLVMVPFDFVHIFVIVRESISPRHCETKKKLYSR
jgi:hypothetical protein